MTAKLEVAQLYATIKVVGINSAERGVGRLKGEVFSLKSALVSLSAGYGVSRLSKSFVDVGSQVEQFHLTLRTVIKDAKEADKAFDWAREFARTTPFNTDEIIATFTMLKAAGLNDLEEIMTALGDAGMVFGREIQDMGMALLGMQKEVWQPMGVEIDRTGKKWKVSLKGQVIETEKDINALRAAVIKLLQENFQGGMEKATDTWKGSMMTISSLWWEFSADLMGEAGSGGPFDSIRKEILKVKDEWSDWAKTDDYKKTIQGIQTKLLGLLDTLSDVGSSFASMFSFAKDHVEGLTLALKTSLGVLVAYKAALLAIPIAAFLANVGAWISLAPLAITSFANMGTWLSMIGLSLGPAGAIAIAVGAGIFVELKEQMRRSAEKAKMLSDAMLTVNEKFSDANKLTLNLLEAELDKTTKKIAELKKEMRKATEEALRLSTAQFMSRNGVAGGALGKALEELRKSQTDATADELEEEKARSQALQKRINELKAILNNNPTSSPTSPNKDNKPSSSLKSSESAASRLVSNMRDQMKYLNIDGETFLGTLDKWMAKLKPLSKDWKNLADLRMEILGDKAEAEAERVAKAAEKVREAQAAAAQGIDKFWSEMRWSYQEGFTSGDDLLKSLQEDFERMKKTLSEESSGLINMSEPLNWTDGMRTRFSEMQSLASELATNQLSTLNQQLQSGVLSQKEWTAEVEKLKTKYGELPKVVNDLNQAQENAKNTSDQFGISAALWADRLGSGLADAIVNAKDLGDALKNIAKQMASSWLQKLIGGWLGGILPSAKGNTFVAPTLSPAVRSMGLAGKEGREAFEPSRKGFGGGVEATENGGGVTNITMNVNAVDSRSFMDMLKNHKAMVESIVVENIYKDGQVRTAIRGAM